MSSVGARLGRRGESGYGMVAQGRAPRGMAGLVGYGAEEFRKHQARNVINSVVEVISPEITPTRAFFNITLSEKNYENIRTIISDEDKRQALLSKALAELHAFELKYSALVELTEVFDAIDNLEIA